MAPGERAATSWKSGGLAGKAGAWALALAVGTVLSGCPKKNQTVGPDDPFTRRSTAIEPEKCNVDSKSAKKGDANEDGKAELVQVMDGASETCRAVDLNFDGIFDRTTFFDEAGKIRRVESDFDRDGRIDEIALFEAGQVREKHRATTMDGKLDTWEFYEAGRLKASERDENGDGVVDQWWEYPEQGCPIIHVDTDGDGRPDPGASIDYCKETGYTPPERPARVDDPDVDYGERPEAVEELSNTPGPGDALDDQDEAVVGDGDPNTRTDDEQGDANGQGDGDERSEKGEE